MGYTLPQTLAAMRAIKAEGGWGVVNTEYCSIHATSDDLSAPFASLWDDDDIRNMALMADAVHRHGSLAGVELWYGGQRSPNNHSRETSLAPGSMMVEHAPWQCQAMDKDDIRAYRRWHRDAAIRARTAGFDIVYVYAAHTYLLAQFLDPIVNQRTDEYGGSWQNRSRLFREVLEDTREVLDGRSALATRIEVTNEDGSGKDERAELLRSISSLVDLFDVTIPDYSQEMGVSRFVKEASLEEHISHVRAVTGKPVVSVGRFTSPETMHSQVRRGVLDLIGAARPSIADPFLPNKIREGRMDDIRECIGCNICYAHDFLGVPIRCTQNPTMGEEWRRGWHPEKVAAAKTREQILIVGGGPAGLEAAVTLGRRGFPVMLAEKDRELGGRVLAESRLPGLREWIRVRDWREQQIASLTNVEVFRESAMTADDIAVSGAAHVLLATGSRWRASGRGRSNPAGMGIENDPRTLTPEAIMAGARPAGPVVIFDDEHYYIAAVLAELLARENTSVTYITPEGVASAWSGMTAEQSRVQANLMSLGVTIITNHTVNGLARDGAVVRCAYTGAERTVPCVGLIPVTSREPDMSLWNDLTREKFVSVRRIGDCKAPGLIAHAVFDGHRAARELGEDPRNIIVRRERVVVDAG
jgi:dimethylamine/trimethylamine dehydrogenase